MVCWGLLILILVRLVIIWESTMETLIFGLIINTTSSLKSPSFTLSKRLFTVLLRGFKLYTFYCMRCKGRLLQCIVTNENDR